MHNFLTEEELIKIEERANAAWPAPWKSFVEGRDFLGGSSIISKGVGDDRGDDIDPLGATPADMDFIASARQDVPRLIIEVKALRSKLRELESNSRTPFSKK